MMNREGHWCAVVVHGKDVSVEDEHQAWHETREPCVFCGRISWTVGTHHVTSSGLPLYPCWRASK